MKLHDEYLLGASQVALIHRSPLLMASFAWKHDTNGLVKHLFYSVLSRFERIR